MTRDEAAILTVRALQVHDEAEAHAAHAELATDHFEFLLEDHADRTWPDYVARLDEVRRGVGLAPDRVPATFLVAEADGHLVGRVSIRHELNDWLARYGGHIGYGVRPAYRGRGYAVALLRAGLAEARAVGVERVLVTCDDDNGASVAVIERCGGVLQDVLPDGDETPKRRYWIENV